MKEQLKTWICTGYPDEENIHFNNHTQIETWECNARDEKEALKKASEHFYYFHEILVQEKKKEESKTR